MELEDGPRAAGASGRDLRGRCSIAGLLRTAVGLAALTCFVGHTRARKADRAAPAAAVAATAVADSFCANSGSRIGANAGAAAGEVGGDGDGAGRAEAR